MKKQNKKKKKKIKWLFPRKSNSQYLLHLKSGKLLGRVTQIDSGIFEVVTLDENNETEYYASREAAEKWLLSELEIDIYLMDNPPKPRPTEPKTYPRPYRAPLPQYALKEEFEERQQRARDERQRRGC